MSSERDHDTRRRLGFVRHLFDIAREQSQGPVPQCYGGILALHDSVELFLALACEIHDAGRMDTDFAGYFNAIQQKLGLELTQRKSLLRFNTARAALKHHGTYPSRDALREFGIVVGLFFEENCPRLFGVDFVAMSLVEFVAHPRAREELETAQEKFSGGDYPECLRHAAIGLEYLLEEFDTVARGFGVSLRVSHSEARYPSEIPEIGRLSDSIYDIQQHIALLARTVALLAAGIEPATLNKFERFTPAVRITAVGEPRTTVGPRSEEPTREDVDFCLNFAVETCIRLETRTRAYSNWMGR